LSRTPLSRDTAPLVVRCDADERIGLGHATRALTLAEALSARLGVEPLLVARESPILERFVAERGVRTRRVEEDGYALDAVLAALSPRAILVTDSYELTHDALDAVAAAGARHVVIDDFAELESWPCDVVVNPNLGAAADRYRGPRRVLVGPRYALMRQEIAQRNGGRRSHGHSRRVVVSLGGGDWGVAGHALLEGLADAVDESTHVRVTTTAACPEPLEAVAPETLAEHLAWADLGVIGGGVVKYEAACLGLPALLIAVVPHQAEVAPLYARAGAARYLGELWRVEPKSVADAIHNLLDSPATLRRMSAAATALVDGRGADRVADAVLQVQ
jgi:UDP-2,4-diacetamido-2,4,6-trideoxy-beta-L-altropyranose hydrolase